MRARVISRLKEAVMRWERLRRSDNVEDRRGQRAIRMGGGFGLGGLILILLASFALGKNPLEILALLQESGLGSAPVQSEPAPPPPEDDANADFVRAILGDTEDTWRQLFERSGARYEEPRLVLFRDAVESACGYQSAAVGPFYCPPDTRVYLDLGFFQELSDRFGAPGDFARAYVIAHEIGHHVQNLMGVSDQVNAQRSRLSEEQNNALSVRVELQADCLAGVWGHYAKQRALVDMSDVQGALAAATAIGDDRIQMRSRGYVAPESFTHGSSEQRVRWFGVGLQSGDVSRCDTYQAPSL
jgi:predicted metalloprotease